MAPRKKLTPEDKKKLDNTKVPNVTTRGMLKAVDKGDWDEADRRHQLMMDAVKKEKKEKK